MSAQHLLRCLSRLHHFTQWVQEFQAAGLLDFGYSSSALCCFSHKGSAASMSAFPSRTSNSVCTSFWALWWGIAYAIVVNALYARGWLLFTCLLTRFTEHAKWTLHPFATFEATSSPTAASRPFIWWSDQSRMMPCSDFPTAKWGWSFFTVSKSDWKHWAYTVGVCLYTIGDQQCRGTLLVPYSNIGGL